MRILATGKQTTESGIWRGPEDRLGCLDRSDEIFLVGLVYGVAIYRHTLFTVPYLDSSGRDGSCSGCQMLDSGTSTSLIIKAKPGLRKANLITKQGWRSVHRTRSTNFIEFVDHQRNVYH